MVNHLCHDRYKKLIPDPDEFKAYLDENPRFKTAMELADAYFTGEARKKWAAKQAQLQAREDEKRARWEKNRVEKQERIAKEKKSSESLRKKMDAKGGSGLMLATADEAELLRSR